MTRHLLAFSPISILFLSSDHSRYVELSLEKFARQGKKLGLSGIREESLRTLVLRKKKDLISSDIEDEKCKKTC